MTERSSIFISYTHNDRARIAPLASYLGRLGLQVWMDTKDLLAGETIIDAVSKAIEKSDLYVVALSPESLKSQWVRHELNTALTFETTRGRPKVLPVLVADTQLPPALAGPLYIDATRSFDEAKHKLKQSVESYLGTEAAAQVAPAKQDAALLISSVRLRLEDETVKYYGGITYDETKQGVQQEATDLIRGLRKRANGILLNFIPASEMDFNSKYFRFPNGNLTERIVETDGDIVGTLKMRSIVEVEVLNPEERKLADLVSTKLASLGVSRVVYSFLLSPPRPDLPQRSLERLQEAHVILGWDPDEGAEVELPDDLKLTVRCTVEEIQIGLETKYAFLFEKRAKEFSVRGFVDWILKDKGS